jgi:hypothetical protein
MLDDEYWLTHKAFIEKYYGDDPDETYQRQYREEHSVLVRYFNMQFESDRTTNPDDELF